MGRRKMGAGWRHSPLLHGQGFVFRYPETDHLALGIEGVEINVGDDPERVRCGAAGKLGQVAIGEARAATIGRARWRRRHPESGPAEAAAAAGTQTQGSQRHRKAVEAPAPDDGGAGGAGGG